MKYEIYTGLNTTDDLSIFECASIGDKGHILKRIEFTPTEFPDIINLAFGDIEEDGQIDDRCISDNGDRNKILATIAFAVDVYLGRYPDKWIYFQGSTDQRTRLYRMAIGLNLDELLTRFEIYGEYAGKIHPIKNNLEVKALLVKKKNV
jgi:hypothetical protein